MSATILHVDFERVFRGAENQMWLLHEGLLQQGWRSFCVCRADTEFDRRAKANAVPNVYAVGSSGIRAGEFDPGLAWALAKVIRQVRPDALHAHSAHAAGVALLSRLFLLGSGLRPKLIIHRTVTDPIRRFSRWKYNRADAVVAVCKAIKDGLVKQGVDEQKIRVIFIGLPEAESCLSEESVNHEKTETKQSANGTLRVGTLSALDGTQKDTATLINAFGRLAAQAPQSELHIFGDGVDRPRLETLVGGLGLKSRVRFHGWWAGELSGALGQMDIFALSSLKEGASNVLVAAMRQGLPCVTTSVGGNPEVLGDAGLLVAPKDAEGMAQALLKLINDPGERRRLGSAARERSYLFSLKRYVIAMTACYSKALNGRS
ncbi:MAG: glycosyltransferase family 4 protein [Elusimicrobia bacterium]|nr:glycosyltransferase family 4 protein [Elusimicrobiota bacterium]